ncbi:DUF4445 domain-containing protein [Oscillospiraceae bacterium CM]|nr:DUF4445 domain-containing protein [Oscillospiraceae bacterium CM]
MNKVIFQFEGGGDVTIFAASGENLLDLAKKANVVIDAPCSGNGSCGKCRVQLMNGDLKCKKSLHLDDREFVEGWRLACTATIIGDVKVLVPDIASAFKYRMKTADLSSPEEVRIFNELQDNLTAAGLQQNGLVRSFSIRMDEPTLSDTLPDNERFMRAVREVTGIQEVVIPFHVLKSLPDMLRDNNYELRCIGEMHDDFVVILDLMSDTGMVPVLGVAIDIGTTTVSALLVDMDTGKIIAKGSAGNGQIRYGADVINRIIEQQKNGGIDKLQKAIIGETLEPLIDMLCDNVNQKKCRIFHMTVASNTTMNHLLLGINADYLRMEPYIPAFFEINPIFTRFIGIRLAVGARLSIAPNIGSYVGGDITAGTLASMIWHKDELSMLIDLGTNGEIVFGNKDFMVSCACSAGPAFEGGDISCGMRAMHGAIEACTIDAETMEPHMTIIGKIRPVGLCGSGIIDVIAELFRTGIINGKGKFVREGRRVKHDEFGFGCYILAFPEESASGRQVCINEIDIDNFIRAKGAIFSAIMTLVSALGFAPEDIEHIDVAGGIGSGINIKNAIRIGMFPDVPLEKYSYVGNSSLAGAYAALVSEDASSKLEEISKSMTYLELSTQPGYMDSFIAACFLPHTNASLFPSVEVNG